MNPSETSSSLAQARHKNGHATNGVGNGTTNGVGNGKLTPRQEEVLLHCVKAGYYEIPRRQTLRSLAKEMGISAPSLSLILRRAEAKLVNDFAQQMAGASADRSN